MPLGHVPGVRLRGLRELPRASQSPHSLQSLALFLLLLILHFSHSVVLFLNALCEADPAGEKWRRQKCVRASRAVHGSSERKGSSHFVHFTPHVHVHLASALSYHEQRAFILLSSVPCFLTWSLDACNAGLMSKPRLTIKPLQFMRHSSHRIFLNVVLI